jgi:hypothetical protein
MRAFEWHISANLLEIMRFFFHSCSGVRDFGYGAQIVDNRIHQDIWKPPVNAGSGS